MTPYLYLALASLLGGGLAGLGADTAGFTTHYVTGAALGSGIALFAVGAWWQDRRRRKTDEAHWARIGAALPDWVLAADDSETAEERLLRGLDALRRRTEDLLVRNRIHLFERDRVTRALDRVPYGVVVTDPESRIVVWNRVATAVLGAESDQCLGRRLQEVAPALEETAETANRTGRATLRAHGDDADREYMVQRHLLSGPDGDKKGEIYTLRDITQLQSSERAQSEFISQISHELKAPLNTIVAYVDALSEPDLLSEDERRQYFNNLSGETHRIADLIGNLLKLSRIELGNLSANFGFVKPGTLVRSIADSFRHQAEDKNQTLRVRVPDTLRPVYGDKDLLGVAVSNLVTNALKYTPEHGSVDVVASDDEEEIRIEVIDSGIGIPEDVAPHVFERFVRSEQDEVTKVGGSGLGLSLVHEIVQLHQGSVTFEPNGESGTRFLIRLPHRDSGDQLNLAA